MSKLLATERMTSINSYFELSNVTTPTTIGFITSSIDMSESTTMYFNTETSKSYVKTEPTHLYANTETLNFYLTSTNLYTNTETTISFAKGKTANFNSDIKTSFFFTETYEVRTVTLGILSNAVSTYQSMFVRNYITGSFVSGNSQLMTFASTAYSSISSYDVITSTLETSHFRFHLFSESHIVDTQRDNFFPIISDSDLSVLSMTKFPSYVIDPYIATSSTLVSVSIAMTETKDSALETTHISLASNTSLITETFKTTINTSYADSNVTSISINVLTSGLQSVSDYASSASTTFDIFFKSESHHLSLLSTEYKSTSQTGYPSYETGSLIEDSNTRIYSSEISHLGIYDSHSRAASSETPRGPMNRIRSSTTDFQSTYFESYSKSTDESFSLKIPEYFVTALQSTSLSYPLNTKANTTGNDSKMKTTYTLNSKIQSGILMTGPSVIANQFHEYSIQISTVLPDYETTSLTTTTNSDSKTMTSLKKSSIQQTINSNSYIEIDTSFKNSSLFSSLLSESSALNDQYMTSEEVVKSTQSFNSVQSGLSEKNKNIIFISTTSGVVTVIVVTLLIILTRMYMSKDEMKQHKKDYNISKSNNIHSTKTVFSDYSLTGKNIHPLLNTASYEKYWNEMV